MRQVDLKAFREDAERYLAGDEVLAIEHHGQTLGYYLPAGTQPRRQLSREVAVAQLAATVQHVLEETGLTEEELSELFDLSKPLPPEYLEPAPAREETHAAGS